MITFINCKFSVIRKALIIAGAVAAVTTQVWASGLPGEHVISDRWRHMYSRYSGITNPAFINEENYMALRFLFANTLQEFYKQETGFTMPIGLYDAAGIAWMMQGASGYEAVDGDGVPLGVTISAQQHFIALTYARNVWNRLTVGGNANIIMQNVPDMDVTTVGNRMRFGFGVDVGLSWKLMRHQLLGNHLLGLSTHNIFNMIFDDTEENYAAALRLSLLSDFWERRVSYGADFVLKDLISASENWHPDSSGVIPWELSQKVGVDILRIFKFYILAGFNPDGFDHYGFAFGINMPGFFNGRDIEGVAQFVSVGNSDANHITFYARAQLGRHREEIYARNMARRGTLGPNNLYNEALQLFYRGEFFRAYWIFSQIAVEYPDFFRNDMVSYYQGASLEGLDMRQAAMTSFRRTKEEHSRSTAVPLADLGLMRVFYRASDHMAVARQFEELNTLGVPDSIKFHAYYLMGQSVLQQGDHARARQLFSQIPDGHPEFPFALHASAVAHAMGDNFAAAIADLEAVIQFRPRNRAQEEVINRSFVFLGFLYYEDLSTEGALARAVTALRRVPRNSYYYQDALLGLGWTALKARQWADCLNAGQDLARHATDPILQSEGALIQAYAHAMQRNYSQAVAILDQAMERLNAFTPPSDSELAANRNEYGGIRGNHENLGMRMDELGQARQSSLVQASIDSLQAPHARSRSAIDQHMRFGDEFRRRSFFARNYEQVKGDIEFASARFIRFAGTRGGGAPRGDTGRDTGTTGIDDELERLRRELEAAD
jgi:TolA-binding protein